MRFGGCASGRHRVGRMSVMWWWALPVASTLTAWAVVLWRSRESVQRDPVVTVQRLSRFRGAMARVHAGHDADWHAASGSVSAVERTAPGQSPSGSASGNERTASGESFSDPSGQP